MQIRRTKNHHSDEESGPFASIFDVFAISNFRSRHLHPFFGHYFFDVLESIFGPPRDSEVSEILDKYLTIPVGFLKVFRRPRLVSRWIWRDSKENLKEISSDPSRPAAGWLSNPLIFIEIS